MYKHFGLVLMVNTGAKFNRCMDYTVGAKAIDRAIASIEPGGVLELGFSGGEPLVEARLVFDFVERARARTCFRDITLRLNLTTNGTQTSEEAWQVMSLADLDLAVSHDGLPHIHDRHRRSVDGQPTSALVEDTIRRLVEGGKDFHVVMGVRPDTVDSLADGMRYLRTLGVTR